MARQRLIKPEFFQHEELYRLEAETARCRHGASTVSVLPLRLAFIGLWTQADRRGLFAWKLAPLKLNICPFDDINFGEVLDALERGGFIQSYEVDGKKYGRIPTFANHQSFNKKEYINKNIPEPRASTVSPRRKHRASTVQAPTVRQASTPCPALSTGTGRSGSKGDMPDADAPAPAVSWPAEAAELWTGKVGPVSPGKAGKLLKPLVDLHGWSTVKAGLADYLTATPTARVRLDWFVEKGTYWIELAKQPIVNPDTGFLTERANVIAPPS